MKYPIRDYSKYPLKKGEYPLKEDVYYFYIEQNLTMQQTADRLHVTMSKITKAVKLYDLRKSIETISASRAQLWTMYSEEYRQKRLQAVRDGFTPEVRKHLSEAVSKQQANETPEQKKARRDAFRKTWKNRTPEQKTQRSEKLKQAAKNRTPEQKKQIVEKFRKSFQKVWYSKTEEEKQEYIDKMQQTKKERGTFNTSKHEDQAYEQIKKLYPNTLRQYKTKEYPFACDFYIPELNLYIEYQESWTHGGRPYVETDEQCKQQLNYWIEKSKTSKFYKVAIQTWTQRDVNKRNIAIQNKLNYLEIFTKQQLIEWLRNSGMTVN